MSKIKVATNEITIIKKGNTDFISLTDLIKVKDGEFFITDWLRNRNTLDYLSVWERLHNPNFNYGEFAIIRNQSGSNLFKISVKEWNDRTNAVGIIAQTGRYGGTYAQQDIAFEFCTWVSPIFKLYLIKEFQRLKEQEAKNTNSQWDYRRFLTKVNYKIHTDAIKGSIIPKYTNLSRDEEGYIYANEAEMLNIVVFGMTSKQWRQENPEMAIKGLNIRDAATIPHLTVLANIENYNAILLKEGMASKERFDRLKQEAISQFNSLASYKYEYPTESPHLSDEKTKSEFDLHLSGLLMVPPPKK